MMLDTYRSVTDPDVIRESIRRKKVADRKKSKRADVGL